MQQPPHPPHPVKKYHLKGGGLPGECVCVCGGGGVDFHDGGVGIKWDDPLCS